MKNKYLVFCTCLFFTIITYAQEPQLMLPLGHTSWVMDGVFSPDNKKVITISKDNTVKIWDVATGLLVADLDIGKGSNLQVVITPLQELMVITSDKITVWSLETAKLLRTIVPPDENSIYATAISADGKLLALGSTLATYLYQFETGKLLFTLKGHEEDVTHCSFSLDNTRLLTAGEMDDNRVVWDCKTGDQLLNLKNDAGLTMVASFTPDGKYIITGSADSLVFYNSNTGEKTFSLPGKGMVHAITFKPNSSGIAVAYEDKLYEWDYDKRILRYSLPLSGNKPRINYNATGGRIAYNLNDSVIIFNTKTLTTEIAKPVHNYLLSQVTFNTVGDKLLTTSLDNTAAIWDVQSGELLQRLKGRSGTLRSAITINTGEFVTSATDSIVRYWNTKEGLVKRSKKLPVSAILLSPKGDKGIITDPSLPYLLYKMRTGEYYKMEGTEINSMLANPVIIGNQGKFAATYTLTSKFISIWELEHGTKAFELGHVSPKSCAFSPNEKRLVSTSWRDSLLNIWDLNTGKLFKSIRSDRSFITANYTQDGKKIVATTADSLIKVFDENGVFIHQYSFINPWINNIYFNASGNRMLVTRDNASPELYDGNNFKLVRTLAEQVNEVTSANFVQSDSFLYTTSKDNSLRKWNAVTGDAIVAFYGLDSLDNLVKTQDGYYRSTPQATRLLHYVTPDLKVISFDQLDLKYNRPDKVLSALANPDTALINSYKKAYYKRIRKLGIDTSQFTDRYNVPEADIINRNDITYEQSKDILSIKVHATDLSYDLDRFNVWVNDVPLYGLRGINISYRNSKTYDTTVLIRLSKGENRIEAGVTNTNGIESYKLPLFAKNNTAAANKEAVYFIGIGINRFADSANNLTWSVKDIRDLSKKLKKHYPNIQIDTLFNEAVTKENILALKHKLQQLTEDDKVIISYSGHGLLSKDLDYYLSTYNINFSKPEENGLAYDELESLLDNIKPRKKLMLIDACHSGEVDKDEIAKIEASKQSLDKLGTKTKSTIKITGKTKLGMTNSFELMQNLFVNVSRGTGATIISAAGGMQYAQERGDLQNGVFTYSIINAFNNNEQLTVSQLKQIVSENVLRLTNGLQKPTSRNETNSYDWVIW